MARKVLILGDSGTGKSASMRNFTGEGVMVINCAGKDLPFRNRIETVTPTFRNMTRDVVDAMEKAAKDGVKVLIVDDAQYIMSFQYMRRIKENGWDKWNDIQGDFFKVVQFCDELPADMVVYFLMHIQRDEAGHEKMKTMGKMLDEKITMEGLFTIVLKTLASDGEYYFATQNSGYDTVKSPMGMFDTFAIDNDLAYVDAKIRNYYGIGDAPTDEEVAAMDVEVAHPEVQKPSADGKKRRSTRKKSEAKVEAKTEDKGEEKGKEKEEQGEAVEEPKPKRRSRKKASEDGEEDAQGTEEAPAEEAEEAAEEQPKRRTRKRRQTELL